MLTKLGRTGLLVAGILMTIVLQAGAVEVNPRGEMPTSVDLIQGDAASTNHGPMWWYRAGPMRLGLLSFGVQGEGPEWNVALVKAADPRHRTWSSIGFGVSVRAEETLLPPPDPLDTVGVGPWVGGCLACRLGAGAQINLEGKWTPGRTSLLGDETWIEEGRVGAALEFRW